MRPRGPRVRAPELAGRAWLNTGGRALSMAGLRGRFVLLDFWTFCCVNCLHVLDELREVERRHRDVLVVIGVHSPKFEHEADPVALAAALQRYEVHHAVLDDPELLTWRQYAVRAWPTLVLVDPEGYVVAQLSGEGHGESLGSLLDELVAAADERGTLRRGDDPFMAPQPAPTALRFPARARLLPDGRYVVADAGHHALAVLDPDAETVHRRIGSGERGLVDGGGDLARFAEPQSLLVLPDDVAAAAGFDLLVADTANHALRSVRLSTGDVATVAGTGHQLMLGGPDALPPAGTSVDALAQGLSSPWDLAWYDGQVVIAMAGTHQLWSFDPVSGTLAVMGGTTNEGLLDGDLAGAWFAQTSALAADGDTLWLVDAETSSLRRVTNGVLHTEVGHGLFDFGHVDGPAREALLQHPLGLAVLPDGTVAIADTYNGAVRRFDPAAARVETLARGLAEPADVLVAGDALVVVESAAHRLTCVPVPEEALRVDEGARRTARPRTEVAAGVVRVEVVFAPPARQKLDDRYGPATHLVVGASPSGLILAGAGAGSDLVRDVVLADDVEEGVLHVSVRAASCDAGDVEFPACHVSQQDWGVPVRVLPGAAKELTLVLRG